MNTRYRTLIVDDDPHIVEQLTSFLAQTGLFKSPTICTNSMEALISLRTSAVDLIFLDMQLPDMPGLDLLRLFPQHAPIIAVSAFPSYAVQCYDCDIADFMAKPLTYSRFLRALRRTVLKSESNPLSVTDHPAAPLPAESNPLPAKPSANDSVAGPTHIFLKTGRKKERFMVKEILYCQAYTLYTKLITPNGLFVINDSLSSLTQSLSADHFLRVHKSYLVNLMHVSQYSANALWLSTHKIPIGVTYKASVQKRIKALPIVVS